MAIDWSLARGQGNAFAAGLDGYQAGRALAKQQGAENALARYASDPEGAIKDLAQFDPATAIRLQEQHRRQVADDRALKTQGTVSELAAKGDFPRAQSAALAGGQFDLAASVAKLDETQRARAIESADTLAAVGNKLKQYPAEQRRAVLQSIKPTLLQRGMTAEQIDGFDPSDANLDGVIGSALDLKTQLDQAIEREKAAATARDQEARRAEQARHNRASEGTAASNAARGWASHKAREASGGYGTPGVGGSVVPDEDVEIDQ